MHTTIELPGARRIWLETVEGIVLDASESSVAVVNQGPERRQFIDGHAVIRPGQISSEIVSIHKVWIRETDGQESAYDLSNFPVDLRAGHKLALVFGAAEGMSNGEVFGALNVTTGRSNFDSCIHCDRLSNFGLYLTPKFYRKRLKRGVLAGAILGVVFMVFGGDLSVLVTSVILGFIAAALVAFVQAIVRQIQGQRLVPELNRQALELLSTRN